jgi:hypothetical protein
MLPRTVAGRLLVADVEAVQLQIGTIPISSSAMPAQHGNHCIGDLNSCCKKTDIHALEKQHSRYASQ